MRKFFSSWLSGDESAVDSVIASGVLALITLLGLCVFVTVKDPTTFSPINFSTGVATIIAGVAGGKTARDRWAMKMPPSDQPGQPNA